MDPLGQLFGLTGLGGAEQDDELFSAITSHQIGRASLGLSQYSGYLLQALIPLGMTEVIVIGLEVVDIDHQYRQRILGAPCRLPFPLHGDVPLAPIGDTSQRIFQREQGEAVIGLLQRPIGFGQLYRAFGNPLLQLAIEPLQLLLGALADQ